MRSLSLAILEFTFQSAGASFSIDISTVLVSILVTLVAWLGKGKFDRIDKDIAIVRTEGERNVKSLGEQIKDSKRELENKINTLKSHKESDCPLCKGIIQDKEKVINLYLSEIGQLQEEENTIQLERIQTDKSLEQEKVNYQLKNNLNYIMLFMKKLCLLE